jgi:hypothetical protein
LKNSLLNQSLAVRTPVLPEVLDKIYDVDPSFDDVYQYRTNIVEWLKPVVDLTGFYVYPTNGITEGLNWWYNREPRSVRLATGEYQWVDPKGSGDDYITYQSIPSAIDGNFHELASGPVALDLAYVGSTNVQTIELHDQVEYAFYSLSKPFGVRNIRTGWLFTRKPDHKLKALTYAAKYYNYYAHNVAEHILENFSIDYVYNRMREQQLEVCAKLELTASDSVWLATTTDPGYKKFFRGDKARICLTEVLEC